MGFAHHCAQNQPARQPHRRHHGKSQQPDQKQRPDQVFDRLGRQRLYGRGEFFRSRRQAPDRGGDPGRGGGGGGGGGGPGPGGGSRTPSIDRRAKGTRNLSEAANHSQKR